MSSQSESESSFLVWLQSKGLSTYAKELEGSTIESFGCYDNSTQFRESVINKLQIVRIADDGKLIKAYEEAYKMTHTPIVSHLSQEAEEDIVSRCYNIKLYYCNFDTRSQKTETNMASQTTDTMNCFLIKNTKNDEKKDCIDGEGNSTFLDTINACNFALAIAGHGVQIFTLNGNGNKVVNVSRDTTRCVVKMELYKDDTSLGVVWEWEDSNPKSVLLVPLIAKSDDKFATMTDFAMICSEKYCNFLPGKESVNISNANYVNDTRQIFTFSYYAVRDDFCRDSESKEPIKTEKKLSILPGLIVTKVGDMANIYYSAPKTANGMSSSADVDNRGYLVSIVSGDSGNYSRKALMLEKQLKDYCVAFDKVISQRIKLNNLRCSEFAPSITEEDKIIESTRNFRINSLKLWNLIAPDRQVQEFTERSAFSSGPTKNANNYGFGSSSGSLALSGSSDAEVVPDTSHPLFENVDFDYLSNTSTNKFLPEGFD